MTGAEIAEVLGMALSTVSGILTRVGLGKLGRLGPGARAALRARASWRADPHRRQEARAHPGRGRAPSHRQAPPQPTLAPTPRESLAATSAGSTSTSRSTTRHAWPTSRSSTTRRRRPRSASFAEPSDIFAGYGINVERVLTDNGSAYRSAIHAIACRDDRHPPPAHPPLQTADQRQGRTLHPHHARRLGLRRHLPLISRTHRRPRPAGWTSTIAGDHTAPSATNPPLTRLHELNGNNLLGTYT